MDVAVDQTGQDPFTSGIDSERCLRGVLENLCAEAANPPAVDQNGIVRPGRCATSIDRHFHR